MTRITWLNLGLIALGAALSLPAQKATPAESLLQMAIKKETVDGDLAGAIEGYKKALAGAKGDRPVAARALFQLGVCYQKQGSAEARRTFERLIREYADQPFVAQARTQLAALGESPKASGIRLQKLFTEGRDACSSVSADGKLLGCAIGWVNEAAVWEVETGRMRVLTQLRKENPSNRYINTFAISPDGKWMALHIYRAGGVFSEISVIPTDGSGALKTIYKHPEGRWLDLHTWTPDSKEVLITVTRKMPPEPNRLMTVSAAGGKTRTLREIDYSLQWAPMAYSPDGKWLALGVPGAEARSFDVELWSAGGALSATVLKSPANEQVVGWSPDGKWLLVTTDRDGSKALHKVGVAGGKVTSPPQLIRAGMDEFRSLGVDAAGALHYNSWRQDSNVYSVSFDPQTGAITGPETLLSNRAMNKQGFASWSPDGGKLAWWTFSSHGGASIANPQVIVRSLPSGPETVAAPALPFYASHSPTWDAEGKALLMLASGATLNNYRLVRLDPASGKTSPISAPFQIQNIGYTPEWTADGRHLFLKQESGDILRKDLKSGEEKIVHRNNPDQTGVRSFQVSPDGTRLAFFANTRVMKAGGEWVATTHRWLHVLDLNTDAVKSIEIEQPQWGAGVIAWTPDGQSLVYSVEDEKKPDLWMVPSDGSAPPRPLTQALDGQVAQIGFSPDGKTLTYTRSPRVGEYWVMERFLQ